MKLSIIIPVYNVENTLRTCVSSAQITTFDDWEIILVDDGSKDSSGEICDQLAQDNPHIRVIHQANGGLSLARNTGIEAAKGGLLTFIDSDDHLAEGTLDKLIPIMYEHPDYDILEYPVEVYHGSSFEKTLTFRPEVYTNMAEYWIGCEAYKHTYACNKIYRKQLFSEVCFPKGRLFEDVHTLPLLLKHTRKVATTDTGLYYYNYNPNSITNTADGRALNDLLEGHLHVLYCEKQLLQGKDYAAYYAHVLNIQLDVYELTGEPPVLPILPYRNTLKLKLMHLLGLKQLCILNKLLHKVVKHSR